MRKENSIYYTWRKTGAWIDEHIDDLECLCIDEGMDLGIKKPEIYVRLDNGLHGEAKFKVRTNSQYVFRYMIMNEAEEKFKKMIENANKNKR